MEDRWPSVDEITAYIGIKRDTVYKWIADKQMPAHKVGRLVNGSASKLLQRELVYSGFLPERPSYSSKLLACLEVAL